MASGSAYLIHYPDGRGSSVHTVIGPQAQVDDVILAGWSVFKLETNELVIDGQAIQFEAWVVPKAGLEGVRAWSLAWRDIWRDNPIS